MLDDVFVDVDDFCLDGCDCCGVLGNLREKLEGEERFLNFASLHKRMPQASVTQMVQEVSCMGAPDTMRLFYVHVLNTYFPDMLRKKEADTMLGFLYSNHHEYMSDTSTYMQDITFVRVGRIMLQLLDELYPQKESFVKRHLTRFVQTLTSSGLRIVDVADI